MDKNSDCDGEDNISGEGKLVIDMDAVPGVPPVSVPDSGITPTDPTPTNNKSSSSGENNRKIKSSTNKQQQPAVKRKASSGGSTPSDFVNRRSTSPDQHSDNNSNNSDNQSLRMKIKRKKMATRQSAASHEASNVDDLNSNSTEKIDGTEKELVSDEKLERRDVGTWVRTIGNATDAECFGPCEPGTAVTLEGIVWHETTGGILVVNVTWRGKSYVGTLLDCTKSDWAAPRFCESPNNDLDGSKTPAKGGRGLKRCAGSSASLNSNNRGNSASTSSDVHNGGQQQKNNQNSKNSESLNILSESCLLSEITPISGSAEGSSTSKPEPILEPTSPMLFECPLNGCEKKYGRLTSLKYHQNSAHFSLAIKRNAAAVPSSDPQPSTIDVNKLSEAENESLENLFKVVDQQQISCTNSKTPPTLLADESRQNGGAYSDISDDEEAPKLERHTNQSFASKCLPEDQQQPPKASTHPPAAQALIATAVVEPEHQAPKTSDLKSHGVKLESSKTNGTCSKKPANNNLVSKQPSIKQEICTSPKLSDKKLNANLSMAQSITAVPYSYATFPNGHPVGRGPIPMSFESAGPLLYGGPAMFAFPVGTQQPMANPSSMFFGMPMQPQPPAMTSTVSHKIHELNETSAGCNKQQTQSSSSSNASNANTGEINKKQQMESSKVHREDKSDTSRSPPIQRHMHTHHHTHSYPIMPTVDYAGFLASHNQQAAATMVGAFPPFQRK